jgi:RHS repeat-associated protein
LVLNRLEIEDRDDDPTTDEDYTRRYVYDANGRLDKVVNADCTSGSDVAEQYTYESNSGEQIAQLKLRVEYQFNPASGACAMTQAASTDVVFGSQSSDQAGAMTQISTDPAGAAPATVVDLTHGSDNQLQSTSVDGDSSTLTRDADGRVMTQTSPDGDDAQSNVDVAKLSYAGSDPAPATIQETGDVEARGRLVAPNGWIIAEHRDPSGYDRYYVTDHLGTPVIEMGRSGTVVGTHDYDAYGTPEQFKTSGAMTTTIGFTGERVDPSTGLTDHDARSYNAALRSWVTTDQYSDPSQDLGLSLDPNNADRMLYAGGNPISNVDPDGHAFRTSGGSTAYVNRATGSIQVNVRGSGGGYSYSYNRGSNSQAAARAAEAAAARMAARAAAKRARDLRIAAARVRVKARADRCNSGGGYLNAQRICVGTRAQRPKPSGPSRGDRIGQVAGAWFGGALAMGAKQPGGWPLRAMGATISVGTLGVSCRNGMNRQCAGTSGSVAGATALGGLGSMVGPAGTFAGAGLGSIAGEELATGVYDNPGNRPANISNRVDDALSPTGLGSMRYWLS